MKLKTKKVILLASAILTLLVDLAYTYAISSGSINFENLGDTIKISNNSQIAILLVCALVNFVSLFLIGANSAVSADSVSENDSAAQTTSAPENDSAAQTTPVSENDSAAQTTPVSENDSAAQTTLAPASLRHKKKLIILNIVQLFIGNIFNIIAGIFNIIILVRRAKDEPEKVKVKKELPVLEDITKHKWYVYLIIFIFLFVICYTPISELLPPSKSKLEKVLRMAALYIIQIVMLVIPMWNELKRDFSVFKNNFKLYLSNMLPRFGIIIIAYLISNLSLISFVGNIPTNQAILSTWPLYITAIIAIFIAPLTEELMFRGFIKKFVKNDVFFVIISSLLFGGLHVLVANNWQQILFIIPYSLLGLAFSLNYVKTRNIASNIFLHSVWNSIAVIAMALLKMMVL